MICDTCESNCLFCPMYQEFLDLRFFGETMSGSSRYKLEPPKNRNKAFDDCIEILDAFRRYLRYVGILSQTMPKF